VDVLSSLGKVGIDTTLGGIGSGLDVEALRARLAQLNQQGQGAAAAAGGSNSMFGFNIEELIKRMTEQINMGVQQAASPQGSVGTFSGQQFAMMGIGSDDLQIRQIEKQEETNRLLREANKRRLGIVD
jgi:hypothetical protein